MRRNGIKISVEFYANAKGKSAKKYSTAEKAFEDILNRIKSLNLMPVVTKIVNEYMVAAIVFQRICSRTPLDEEYYYGAKSLHRPDKSICRYDWSISDGKKTLMALDLVDNDSSMYLEFGNQNAIDKIFKKIETELDINGNNLSFKFENKNPHFKYLEYGGIRHKQVLSIKQGEHYEHGIDNERSIQAPIGMYRITMMEIDDIRKGLANDDSVLLKSSKVLQRKAIAALLRNRDIKKLGFNVSDIERYINGGNK